MEKEKHKHILSNANIMDYLVVICILSVLIFVSVSLYFYYKIGIPPSEMKTEFFAFFGAELLAMATIKISGNVTKKKDEEVG